MWKSPADKQAFAATEPVTKYRAALLPLQSAPYDERIHNAFSVGATAPLSGDPVVLMTHVDIIPTQVEPGTPGESFRRGGPRRSRQSPLR